MHSRVHMCTDKHIHVFLTPHTHPFTSPELSDRAWGRSRKTFYSTDYIDDELGGSEEEKEAEEEEREALALQQRMVAALDEQDFELPEIMVCVCVHMCVHACVRVCMSVVFFCPSGRGR